MKMNCRLKCNFSAILESVAKSVEVTWLDDERPRTISEIMGFSKGILEGLFETLLNDNDFLAGFARKQGFHEFADFSDGSPESDELLKTFISTGLDKGVASDFLKVLKEMTRRRKEKNKEQETEKETE